MMEKKPEYAKEKLHGLLDDLLKAYESKGTHIADTLLPPVAEEEIKEQCSWFPTELPQEIIALYSWRAGQKDDAQDPFAFRDNTFHTLIAAKYEYESMMESYGVNPEDHDLLKYSFPFASYDGSFYVLPAKEYSFNVSHEKPIISVFQGVDIFFYSIESMVSACIDWVSNSKYDNGYLSLSEKNEMEIWNKYNPGVFDG